MIFLESLEERCLVISQLTFLLIHKEISSISAAQTSLLSIAQTESGVGSGFAWLITTRSVEDETHAHFSPIGSRMHPICWESHLSHRVSWYRYMPLLSLTKDGERYPASRFEGDLFYGVAKH
jgi:hypothetical protein